jgi:adenylylsulfate kinase-like enzyme
MAGVPTLLLTGTIGSGKTVVAAELGLLLEERAIPAALIDLDWLNWVHLGPSFEDSDGLLARNLAAIWPNFAAAGAEVFVLVRAVDRAETIRVIRAAFPEADLTVVRLVASPATIRERLRRRDAGAVLAGHLEESEAFAAAMDVAGLDGIVVQNEDREVRAVAEEVLQAWQPARG